MPRPHNSTHSTLRPLDRSVLRVDTERRFAPSNVSRFFGFSLIELLVVISLIAILTAAMIPTFGGFSRAQNLTQSFKSLKSDVRSIQSRSLTGVKGKAWGLHFDKSSLVDPGDNREYRSKYRIFYCSPVTTISDYPLYLIGTAQCPLSPDFKFVNLSPNVILLDLKVTTAGILVSVNTLDVVFDSLTGSVIVNGARASGDAEVILDHSTGAGTPQTVRITPGGGVIE